MEEEEGEPRAERRATPALLRSKYDLPLERKRRVTINPAATTIKSRFDDLDEHFLHAVVKQRPTYGSVREVALQLLHQEATRKLRIVDLINVFPNERHVNTILPNNLFSWLREDFLTRRALPDTLWLTLLQKQIDEPSLEALKFKTDLRHLADFLALIFGAFANAGKDSSAGVAGQVLEYVKDAHDFVHVVETVTDELKANKVEFRKKLNDLLRMRFKKRDEEAISLKANVEQRLMTALVLGPIELRYQTQHYESQAAQQQCKLDAMEEQLQHQITFYEQKTQREMLRAEHTRSMHAAEIEKYRARINLYSKKYERAYDDTDNKLNYTKIAIEKLKEQRRFFEEQLERFREELRVARLKAVADAEAAKAAREAAAELAATMAPKVKNKPKKKAGGKKKK